MLGLKINPLVLVAPLATAIGGFGGFPAPPKVFLELIKYQLVQWCLLWVLIYQGGAGQYPIFTSVITAFVFVLYKVIRFFESKGEDNDE